MKQQSSIQQKLKLIKNQNYFCDERSLPSQAQISQNDITNNIYYKLDQMKQDDLIGRERSVSDYQKPVNISRISHHFKQKQQLTTNQAKSINKHIKNFAENHYFAQSIGSHTNVSGQQLSQNNTKHTQNNILQSFSQEEYFSDQQKLTPRMNFYLSSRSRTQQNEAQMNKDSDIYTSQVSQSQAITPRYYFNYKMLLQNNKILPNYFTSKIALNSTSQESDLNLKIKESEQNIKNKEVEQNFKSKNSEQIFKQADSFIYDDKQNSHHKDQKNSSFLNSQTVSDLILEDMTPIQFKISNAPSFLDQKQEELLNTNQIYPLVDNLLSDSFYLDEGCKELTDSELIIKNPNEFFQKVGIKPLNASQNKKKPLNLYLTEHVEKELAMMKQFDQSQIQDKKLNQNHFNNFVQQSKELIEEDQQLPYQDVEKLIFEKKQSNKIRLDSPKCQQKNLNLIILKNKYNVVKERIKIEKKDLTTSYLYENREQLKLDYQDLDDQLYKKKKNLRDILLSNKEKEIFNSVDNFKKILKFKKMLKFQDVVQQTFQNHKKNQAEINENQHQISQIQKANTLNNYNQIPVDQTENKLQQKQPEHIEEEQKQAYSISSSIQINKTQQAINDQNLLKQVSLNQVQYQRDKQINHLHQKPQSNEDMQQHQIQQKIQDNQKINLPNQNQMKLNFWRVSSSKQLNQEEDKTQSNPSTQRSQTPKIKFKNHDEQTFKNIKWQQNKCIDLKKSFLQNKNQINKKNRIYSASPDSNQKIASFSFQKQQKQLHFSKDQISDRPYSQNIQNKPINTQILKSNQNISSSVYLRTQTKKNEMDQFKEQEASSKNKNQRLFEKLKQLNKNKQPNKKLEMGKIFLHEKSQQKKLFSNNISEQTQGQQLGNSYFQTDQENQTLNNSFAISKQHVKNELNTVEKQIQNQRLLIGNIQQKKGEYLSPFREKPSNQFIYDHMFYQKHIQLLISVNKKYENLDL
ncbi:hypothetical protein TTHERM_00457030 (macronuclear) [Tetrahymena thermophila SB210]|uniref:Uncharacterized protein n=1 Tax=Tetrahymena thermophila (strain SB210) TaxID=312017 RepID=I7MI79_TETTS|nr:hypothetical protein TTHERM_00457030 [Tetrahymena thermophila SB210]EAS03965.2 hypothetical protein TTHERM_00457030 [Tetrahymena thermophila SB210]|eukprot:XP_001024210.2 hypothetical protein TTHERM_00457030 [Tetrahymena thermophila SB210]